MIAVPLARDGEPFLADANSVTWSLRGHDGLLDAARTNVAYAGVNDTTLLIAVPAAANAMTIGRLFEKRTVVVRGLRDGEPFIAAAQYRLAPWLNHSVTTDLVRAFIGTDAGELPDADIDLVAAYYDLATLVGVDTLATTLSSGTELEIRANDAIKGIAVLRVLPGVRQRMLKRAEDGTLKSERFAIDFDKLAADAAALVTRAGIEVGGIDDTAVAPIIFILAGPTTDPVTGGAV